MASRVNVKFTIILILVVIAAAGVVGGLWFYQVVRDAQRNIDEGDHQMAQGDYRQAKRFYLRAVHKEPANMEYVGRVEKALLAIQPDTPGEASELYAEYVRVLFHAAEHHPTDVAKHHRLLREVFEAARRSNYIVYWELVVRAAEKMWLALPPGNPDRIDAKYYLAAARLDEHTRDRLPTDEGPQLEIGEHDLREFLAAKPDDDAGWAALVRAHVTEYEELLALGEASRAEEMLQTAHETAEQALAHVPDGLETLIAVLRLNHDDYKRGSLTEPADVIRARLQNVSRQVRQRTEDEAASPWVVMQAAEVINSLSWAEDAEDPMVIIDAYLAKHPETHDFRLRKARRYYLAQEYEAAEEQTRILVDAPLMNVGFLSQLQSEIKKRAASLNVDIAYRRWTEAAEEDASAELETVIAARDFLATFVTDPANDPLLIRADAKIAFAQREFPRAERLFERLVREGKIVDGELLLFAAICHENQGNVGEAADRIEEALSLQPLNTMFWRYKISLHLSQHEYEDAEAAIRRLRQIEPEGSIADLTERLDQLRGQSTDPIQVTLEAAEEAVRNGDMDGAMTILGDALADAPDDVRLLNAIIRVEMMIGNRDAAAGHLARALELAPQSASFNTLRVILENDDPIERLRQIGELYVEDEAERIVDMLFGLAALVDQENRRIELLQQRDLAQRVEETRQLIQRAEAELATYLAQAMERAPTNRRLIEFRFLRATRARQWEEAEQIVELAREHDADLAQGELFQGRLELARGEFEVAARSLTRATDFIPYAAHVWRLLASAYEQVGNLPAALSAYENAFQRDARDVATIKAYARLLERTGEDARALNLVRRGRRVAPRDKELWQLWLQVEARAGDSALALWERSRAYREWQDQLLALQAQDRPEQYEDARKDPSKIRNAKILAAMLGTMEPTRQLLLDDDGEEQYSAERWNRLGSRQQQVILHEARRAWRDEADRLLEEMMDESQRDVTWYVLKASLLRARGEAEAGETILTECFERQDKPDSRYLALLSLAFYQSEVDDYARAVQSYEQARVDFPDRRQEVDYYLSQFYYRLNQMTEALELMDAVLAAGSGAEFQVTGLELSSYEFVVRRVMRRDVELQAIDCLVKFRRFDEATSRLEAVVAAYGADVQTVLVEASIALAESDALLRNGQIDEALARDERYLQLLDRAERLDPVNPLPHVLRAGQYLRTWGRTREARLLDHALGQLNHAEQKRAGLPRTRMVRATVLQAKGDTDGAVNELQRLLADAPQDDRARMVLVQLLLEGGRNGEAVAAAEEGVRVNPASVAWIERLGDLLLSVQNDPAGAAQYYTVALRSRQTTRLVGKLAQALIEQDPPEFRRAAELVQSHPDQLAADPHIRMMYVRALMGLGRRDEAITEARTAYGEYRQLIDAGRVGQAGIGDWFRQIRWLFREDQVAEIDALVNEVTDGKPGPYELRQVALFWRSAGNLDRAVELQNRAIAACTPEDEALLAILYRDRGIAAVMGGQWPQAVEAFEHVIELNERDFETLNNLAYLLADELDDPQRALPYAERAAELKPSDWSILDTVGWIHCQLGNFDQAERYLRRSIQIERTAINHLHRAHVFFEQEDLSQAKRDLTRAAELRPDDETQAAINRLSDRIRAAEAGGTGSGTGR